MDPLRPLALSHHHIGQEERCLRLGSVHLCRRCSLLYPIAFAVMFFSFGGLHWPVGWDRALLIALPAAVAIEYVLEQLGHLRYSARRQAWTTILAAPALGRGFARYLSTPDDTSLRWLLGGVGGAAALGWLLGQERARRARGRDRRAEMVWADVDFADETAVESVLGRLGPFDTSTQ